MRRFPAARVFGIDVLGDSWGAAAILDYEPGNACYSPEKLRAWCVAREKFRPYTAVVYCDRSDLEGAERALAGVWHYCTRGHRHTVWIEIYQPTHWGFCYGCHRQHNWL